MSLFVIPCRAIQQVKIVERVVIPRYARDSRKKLFHNRVIAIIS